MIRDVVRLACVCAGMAVASSLIIETRFQLASIDTAHRYAVSASPVYPQPAAATPPGRLRAFGRAVLDLADAGLGVVR
jgi:hypothetical protein